MPKSLDIEMLSEAEVEWRPKRIYGGFQKRAVKESGVKCAISGIVQREVINEAKELEQQEEAPMRIICD